MLKLIQASPRADRERRVDESLDRWIVETVKNFEVVKFSSLKELIKSACPVLNLPSRAVVSRKISDRMEMLDQQML